MEGTKLFFGSTKPLESLTKLFRGSTKPSESKKKKFVWGSTKPPEIPPKPSDSPPKLFYGSKKPSESLFYGFVDPHNSFVGLTGGFVDP